jgi:leucyl-tRNA synthetase
VDALRAYVLFLGPFDAKALWDDRGIIGVDRFLDRYWRLAQEVAALPTARPTTPSSAPAIASSSALRTTWRAFASTPPWRR